MRRGRKKSIAHKKDCDDKTCRSQDVAVQSVRLNEVFQGEDRELETQTELNTANDGLRHYPSEQFYEPCQREHQHDNANSQACAEKDVPTQFLADNQSGHRFQRLDRHRHSINQAGQNLHCAEQNQHACVVEFGNEDEANGYGPPRRPKRGYHGKRDLKPQDE